MSTFNDMAQNFIYEKRSGTIDDPYVPITESFKIINNLILLSEIPSEFDHVTVTGNNVTWTEVYNDDYIDIDNFKVDYNTGFIQFHPSRNGLTNSFIYKGTGVIFVSATRIFTKKSNNQVVETLQNIVDASVTKFIYSTNNPIDDDGNPDGTVWFKYIP